MKEEKNYIIRAEYGSMPYYIYKSKNDNKPYMEKFRAWQIYDNDFGYSLEEAKEILKMYKAYKKKKMKEYNEYLDSFSEHGLARPTWNRPYLATEYYLEKLSKLKNNIEKTRMPNGEYQYKWRDNGK